MTFKSHCLILMGFTLIGISSSANAEDANLTPPQQVTQLINDYNESRNALKKERNPAKRKELIRSLPRQFTQIDKILVIAEKEPTSPEIGKGLEWVVRYYNPNQLPRVTKLLFDKYKDEDVMLTYASYMTHEMEVGPENIRMVITQNTRDDIKVIATYYLSSLLKKKATYTPNLSDEEKNKLLDESNQLVRKLAEYPKLEEINAVLAKRVKAAAFGMNNLAIGKKAPDIVGVDESGKSFKLSDYKGKVVLLSFWGFW